MGKMDAPGPYEEQIHWREARMEFPDAKQRKVALAFTHWKSNAAAKPIYPFGGLHVVEDADVAGGDASGETSAG